jgi:hypothetical protein
VDDYGDGKTVCSAVMSYVTVGTGITQLLPQAPNRRAIVVSAPLTGSLQLFWDPAPGANPGIVLTAGQPPVTLCRRDYGGLVTFPLFATSPGGAQVVAVATEQGQ